MDWQDELIRLYYLVYDEFKSGLYLHCQRFMKNIDSIELRFTDEEAITVYLFGLSRGYRKVSDLHKYAVDHLSDWFKNLPSYQKFNERLNRLNGVLGHFVGRLVELLPFPEHLVGFNEALVDSMPIVMARGNRADSARVAREVANKGFCSTKNMWYHGLRLHQLGINNPGGLPIPFVMVLSEASMNDNTVFKDELAHHAPGFSIFGDKIYDDRAAIPDLANLYQINMLAAIRRRKGQKYLHADQKYFNNAVSQVRQPIESFFNWLEERAGIQIASKVRSTTGLFKHIWGRIATALLFWMKFF